MCVKHARLLVNALREAIEQVSWDRGDSQLATLPSVAIVDDVADSFRRVDVTARFTTTDGCSPGQQMMWVRAGAASSLLSSFWRGGIVTRNLTPAWQVSFRHHLPCLELQPVCPHATASRLRTMLCRGRGHPWETRGCRWRRSRRSANGWRLLLP